MARTLYRPGQTEPLPLSRSKVELFVNCPRCFWLDRRLGVSHVDTPAFSLNMAVDELLKREFDHYRRMAQPHPLMTSSGLRAIPFSHPQLGEWRTNQKGIRFHDEARGLILQGAVDDIWQNESGELHVVDYKATATTQAITLDSDYRRAYTRQLEIYRWLLRKNGFTVSPRSFILYCNADKRAERFDGRLQFEQQLLSHHCGDDAWIEMTLDQLKDVLDRNSPPAAGVNCKWCAYTNAVAQALPH